MISDPFTLVARVLPQLWNMRRNFKKEKYPQSSRIPRGKQFIPSKSNILTCFECGVRDHFIRDFLNKKKEDKTEDKRDEKRKNFKIKDDKKHDKKKAMFGTWSDTNSSRETENNSNDLCLMARQDSTRIQKLLLRCLINRFLIVDVQSL